MSVKQKERINSTLFGHLLELPYIKQNRPLLDALLSFWDDEAKHFRFSKTIVQFVGTNIILALGLNAIGDVIILDREEKVESNLVNYFF